MGKNIWIEVALAERYFRPFLRNGILEELELTPSEYLVLQILLKLDKRVSFYELKKASPIDTKHLHTTVKSLVDKEYLEREFLENTSEIFILPSAKERLMNSISSEYFEMTEYFGREKTDRLIYMMQEFNSTLGEYLGYEIIK